VDLVLEEIAKLAGQFGTARIVIEGHTDNSMKGKIGPALVKELSLNRANAVKEALVNKYPLDPEPIQRGRNGLGPAGQSSVIRTTMRKTAGLKSRSIQRRRVARFVSGESLENLISPVNRRRFPRTRHRSPNEPRPTRRPRCVSLNRTKSANKRAPTEPNDPIGEKPLPPESVAARPARDWFSLRQPASLLQSVTLGTAMIVAVFAIWWFLTNGDSPEERIVSPAILPGPGETLKSFPELWFDRALLRNTIATIIRVALGFSLATIVGVPLGVLAGCFAPIRALFAPVVIFGRNIPIAALIPITMILFLDFDQYGETQKIMFIFIACVAFIIADTTTAILDVGQKYVDTAYTLGATRWQVIMKVLFPLAIPSVFNSLRLLFGLAFGYIMLAELFKAAGSYGGLGHLINTSQRRGKYDHIYLIILIIPILALIIDQTLYFIQRQLFPYRYKSMGLLNYLVREILAIWDHLKTQLFGTKPPFDKLVLPSKPTPSSDANKKSQTESDGSSA
jgi:ABC-type nitrate/sulfonate/bicarbonate transport system permease component